LSVSHDIQPQIDSEGLGGEGDGELETVFCLPTMEKFTVGAFDCHQGEPRVGQRVVASGLDGAGEAPVAVTGHKGCTGAYDYDEYKNESFHG
jgi:hypothetical protein